MRKLLFSAAIVMSIVTLSSAPSGFAATTQLGPLSIISVSIDQQTVTVTPPTSNSPGAWSISLDNPALATTNGLTLTLKAVGAGQLTFTQAAAGGYNSVSRSTVFRINPGTPVLGSWASLTVPLTAGTFKITPPTSSSTGTWIYTLSNNVSNGYTLATIAGNVVTLLDAGTVTINATQAATSTYSSATTTNTLQITALKPTVGAFSDVSISKDSVTSFNLKVPTSNSPGTWTFTSSLPGVASVAGSVVTPNSVGTTVITAHQAPAAGFQSATLTMNLTITATPPTVGTLAPINYTLRSTPSNNLSLVAPTSNSTGTWVYTVADPTIATVSGNTLTILKAGSTTISAKQNPTSTFGYSAVVTAPLTVNQIAPIPTLPNLNQVVGDPAIQITPPTTGSPGAWSLTSSDPSIASVTGLSISVVNAGSATLTLTQAASGTWLTNSTTFTISVAGLVPTIGSLSPISVSLGAPVTIVNPTSNSTGVWSYSVGNSGIAKIVNGQLVPVAVGTTTISAVQKPAGKYGQSNTVQSTVTITSAPKPTPTPTPTPTVKPTPTPTVKPTPTPTVKPVPTPTVKPKPTPTKEPVVPIVSAKAVGRSIVVSAKNGVVIVHINGRIGKVGKNPVAAGNDLVVIEFQSRVIYSKVFAIK